ncbi:outer membrane protein assembly factor [Niveibacterium sp. COAC-50]|uniref:outer membrane protein assembly factor n=1 Tax=Niveibacterium sp. COAC-50 TaxID=2729384 RepID=UPI001C12EE63|nr:outer membrane protein assembly factor [Niveibacterium sp. COAC-50]
MDAHVPQRARLAGLMTALLVRGGTLLLGLCAGAAFAAPEKFTDPEDGRFDTSEYLLDYKGLLPVPVIITEPAVGYGGGMVAAFFDQSMSEAAQKNLEESGRAAPPNISAIGGFKTENGTWGGFAGHMHTWQGDRIRYLGGVAKLDIRLDYYGLTGQARRYGVEGLGTVQQVLMRVADTPWLVGARYAYLDSTMSFERERPPELLPESTKARIGSAGLLVDYDTRDNFLSPNKGTYVEGEANFIRPALGASMSFDLYGLRAYHWLQLAPQWVLGLRGDYQHATDGVPFWGQPFVKLRGIPAARYQDRSTAVGELELRWALDERWWLVGFSGAGKAYGPRTEFSAAEIAYAWGGGFRYLIARKLGLLAGLDVARGPEDSAFYIQVGSAWR